MNKFFLFVTIAVTLLAASCTSTPTQEASPTSTAKPSASNETIVTRALLTFSFENPPSIEFQIIESDIIVVATLVSATAAVQQKGDLYRPGQALRFRSSEYLKGSGPTEFIVEVPILEFPPTNRADAMTASQKYIEIRDATYDSRPGVLFLQGPLAAATLTTEQTDPDGSTRNTPNTLAASAFNFVEGNLDTGSWEYSVNTKERVWLPAKDSSGSGALEGRTANTNTEYITDGQKAPPDSITLSDLRGKINSIETKLANGADIEGFRECVWYSLSRERFYRNREVLTFSYAISSGSDPETQPLVDELVGTPDGYWQFNHEGRDADLFESKAIDDDDNPGGHRLWTGPSRPLPSGQYEFGSVYYPSIYLPCEFVPDPVDEHEVTVTAPARTLHESFFDPVGRGHSGGGRLDQRGCSVPRSSP